MTELLGRPVADAITAKTTEDITRLKEMGIYPKLAVIRLGARDDDLAYERGIKKRFQSAGCEVEVFELAEDCSQEEFDSCFDARNNDKSISAILLFRPLPKHISGDHVRMTIDPDKDIDAMGLYHQAALFADSKKAFAPCTAQAVMEMLHFYGIPVEGKRVTVVGRSLVIGKPVSLLLTKENATVTVCHTRTRDLAEEIKRADIVIAAAGKAKMITEDLISSGQIVIDVGMNTDESGKLCGDVDYGPVSEIAGAITPVPGGVGAVTTSVLLQYTVTGAARAGHVEL